MREATRQFRTSRRSATLVLAAVLLAPAGAVPDTLKIEHADPPRSYRFSRGSDPIEIAITVRYEVKAADGGEIAFAVHDQKDRPLMTKPMPIAKVQQGEDSIIFRTKVKPLDPDVKSVVVEAVLLSAIRTPGPKQPGEIWQAKLSYKVK